MQVHIVHASNTDITGSVGGRVYIESNALRSEMRDYGLLLVTDKNLGKIYGESIIDRTGDYFINDLPLKQDLYIFYLFRSAVYGFRDFSVGPEHTKNIYVHTDSKSLAKLNDLLVSRFGALLPDESLFASTVCGTDTSPVKLLAQHLQTSRLVGNWRVTGAVEKSSIANEKATVNGTFHLVLDEDRIVVHPVGLHANWTVCVKRNRQQKSQHWDKYGLVLTVFVNERVVDEMNVDLIYDNNEYQALLWETNSDLTFYLSRLE